jgi:hypothetical protein
MSLAEWQLKAGMHLPPWQLVVQQSAASAQESPVVLHAAPASGWQVPLQEREQHSAPEPQAVPLGLQTVSPQMPPVQVPEQQSLGLVQALPTFLQNRVVVQRWVVALQAVEQHSAFALHAPESRHWETGAAHWCVEGLQ